MIIFFNRFLCVCVRSRACGGVGGGEETQVETIATIAASGNVNIALIRL